MKIVTLFCFYFLAVNICPQPTPPLPYPVEEEEIPARMKTH